jgi:ATP-dependent protease ClpP protease subunit
MTIWKTWLTLFIIGALVCAINAKASVSSETIVLTEDNHIVFSGVVNDESVAKAQVDLVRVALKTPISQPIYLVIESPGGSVTAGNRFIDFGNSFPHKIKPICLFCASMGYHMFQSFDERIVYSSSTLMSHRVSIGGLSGQVPGEAVSRLNDIISVSGEMDAKVAKRIGITLKAYQELIYDELWLSGDGAVKTNHADRIAKIRCHESLFKNTQKSQVMTMFGPVDVESSRCPLVSGFLDAAAGKNSTFRNKEEMIKELRKTKRRITTEY